MIAMRELSDEFKLSVRTIAEVFQGLTMLVARLASDRSIRFREKGKEKRPTRAAIVSALILWLDSQPAVEQRRIVADGMKRLNDLLDLDESRPVDAESAAPEVVRAEEVDVKTGEPVKGRQRREKRA